jgi:Protein of unknown function (DUF3309)
MPAVESAERAKTSKEKQVMTILLIILVLLLIGAIPAWPYSRNWGPYPSGGLGLILLIVVILWLLHVV